MSSRASDDTIEALGRARPVADRATEAAIARVRAAVLDRPIDGPRLGRFRIERRIGRGGMGVVYEAHDPTLDRAIALKVVDIAGPHDRERVLEEARAQARVAHPNVVPIFDVQDHGDVVAIAMERADGDLARWLATPRDWRAITEVFAAAGRGLAAAHARGLVHGDVKPANILIGRDGWPRVADFGLARRCDRDGAAPPGGTPAYMAPELLAGATPSPASDQYAFAVSLAEALAGRRPGAGRGQPRPALPRGVPAALAALLTRALAEAPGGRFASMAAVVDELEAVVRHRAPATTRRRIAMATAAIAAGSLIALIAAAGTGAAPRSAERLTRDRAEVQRALDGLTAAYDAEDVERTMSFFADDPGTTAIGTAPDEHRVGLPAIRALVERDFARSDAISLRLTATEIEIDGPTASSTSNGTLAFTANGVPNEVPIRLTAELVERPAAGRSRAATCRCRWRTRERRGRGAR